MSDLIRHPVHRTLTRPQMFAGVTMNFFVINMMVTTIAFLILSDFLSSTLMLLAFLLVPLVTHLIGYFASCGSRAYLTFGSPRFRNVRGLRILSAGGAILMHPDSILLAS